MCTYSMIADHYRDMWQQKQWYPGQLNPVPMPNQNINWPTQPQITREEFDELKRQVSEMRDLLTRAKEYDERNGEPECEMAEKVEILRKVARIVGVDISDITPEQKG